MTGAEPGYGGPRKQKLDPYKPIIDERLRESPKLSAQRLFAEVADRRRQGSDEVAATGYQ